jgi:hypothetical protein
MHYIVFHYVIIEIRATSCSKSFFHSRVSKINATYLMHTPFPP